MIGVPEWAKDTFPEPLDYRSIMGTSKIQIIKRFTAITSIGVIYVPAGFVSDGASVPQIFWSIFPPFGKYLEAAVVHDYIYEELCHKFTKEKADRVFKELLKVLRISSVKRNTMYQCVKYGGKGGW